MGVGLTNLNTCNQATTVLFLTDRIFWPANDGHKVVLSNYCRSLVEEYGCRVHILTFFEPGQSRDSLANPPRYISSVEALDKPSKPRVVRNLLSIMLPGASDEPAQCALFKTKKAAIKIKAAVEKLQPDYIFFDLARLSPFVGCVINYPCKKVLYLEDLFSKRYARQAESLSTLKKTGGAAGKYSAEVSGVVAKICSAKVFEKMLLRFESKRMKRLECDAVHIFDYVILVSPNEAEHLIKETGAQNIVAIPLGIDCSFFTSGAHPAIRSNVLSFLGDMRSSANADSLRFIVNEILPLIKTDVVLEISGTAPTELQDEFRSNKRVRFLGRVEDTRKTLRSSSIFLAPIAYGTGIKTKILEAMAIGVPIITNSIGNEGIGLLDGKDALIGDSKEEIADDVVCLLNDRQLASELARAAQTKAVEEFDWARSLRQFALLGFSQADDSI